MRLNIQRYRNQRERMNKMYVCIFLKNHKCHSKETRNVKVVGSLNVIILDSAIKYIFVQVYMTHFSPAFCSLKTTYHDSL